MPYRDTKMQTKGRTDCHGMIDRSRDGGKDKGKGIILYRIKHRSRDMDRPTRMCRQRS